MPYDFTTLWQRHDWDAQAVDGLGAGDGFAPDPPNPGFDIIPMWVADMNFATAPSIPSAISKRLSHPLYGYFEIREEYYDAIIGWQSQRNGVCGLTKDAIGYENGVLGGMMSVMQALFPRGSSVLLHSPTYIGFTGSLEAAGYRIILSPLVQDEQGIWRMDLRDMEEKIRTHQIKVAVFCSPHNPSGRVWERKELEAVMELYEKYDLTVISDEIWSDILLGGNCHIPIQSISEDAKMRTVALYAPSKTFNLAGLVGSYHIIYNPALREQVRRQASICHYNNINLLSMYGLIGAYSQEGSQWLDELCQVLTQNVDYACRYIADHFSGVTVSRPQGTYMLFLDCTEWCRSHGMTLDQLLKAAWDVGVAVQDGRPFHGDCHIRMNLALPLSRLQEAMKRLSTHVFSA